MESNSRVLQTVVEIAGSLSPTLKSSVEKACDQLDNINVKAAAVAAAAAAGFVAVGKAILEAGKALVELGDEYDKAMQKVSAQTGATGDELEELGEVVKTVYGDNFGDSMEDAAAAVAEVKQLTDLEGDALASAAEDALSLAKAFEFDVSESTRAASALMKNFGITADEAYNIIAYGAQNGANQNGDMLDVLNEYAAQYSALGLSADQFVQGLVAAGDEGVFSMDKVGDAVKEFNIRSKDLSTTSAEAYALLGMDADEMFARFAAGGETANEAFFEVLDALNNMDDPLAKNTAAVNLFGTQYEDLGESILPILASMEEATLDNVDALEAINEVQYGDLQTMWQGIVRQLEVSLLPLASTLLDSIKGLMPAVSDLADAVIPLITETSEILTPLITDTFAELLPMVSSLIQPIMQIANTVLKKVLPPLMRIITAVLPVIIQLVEMIAIAVEPVLDVLGAVLPIIAELIEAIMTVLGRLLSTLMPVLSELLGEITPILTSLVEAVLPVLISLLDTLMPILDIVLSVLEPILDVVVAILKPILTLINSLLGPLMSMIQSLVGDALAPLADAIGVVADLFSGTLGAALSVVTPLIEMITGVLSGLIDFITNIFSGNWSGAWQSIADIFSNIWNGIVNFFKGLINGLIGIVETGLNAIIGLINNITGGLSKVWTWTGIPAIPEIPTVKLPRLASGGFTDGVSIAGEEGMEAVISFDPAYHAQNVELWHHAGELLGVIDTVEMSDEARAGVTAAVRSLDVTAAVQTLEVSVADGQQATQLTKAGELATMDEFSLGSLTETTIIYYDFSNFTWAPRVETDGSSDTQTADDIVERLRDHASEFFDWLDDWLRMKEEGRYDRVTVY
ncbi:MAG TPA: phage tail tape measure protein [Candidatus Coproplasma excrementipullorum]|nr:phage tail tape measure protein [Candidatus Coproplasma excrementipullorum]